MSEHGQQPGPATRTSAFDGAGRYVEDTGRLCHGVTLHIHQNQRGPLIDGEFCQRGQELAMEILTLGGGLSGLMRFEELLKALGVIDG